MSLLELKLTVLEDSLKKHKDRWKSEYIRANWLFEPILYISPFEIETSSATIYQKSKI